jgi:hypothetical protein
MRTVQHWFIPPSRTIMYVFRKLFIRPTIQGMTLHIFNEKRVLFNEFQRLEMKAKFHE